MTFLNNDNIIYRGYKYLFTGARELLVKYVLLDTISDTMLHLLLNGYFSIVLSYVGRKNDFTASHNCNSPICSHAFLSSIAYFAKEVNTQPYAQEKVAFSYLDGFFKEAGKVIHFHASSKIIGIALSPIAYGLKENLYHLFSDDSVFYSIGNFAIKTGQYVGINPYESVFALDELACNNNSFVQFVAQNDILERKASQDYSKYMDFVNNIWIESFVDSMEHATEYFVILDKLFEFKDFFSEGLNLVDFKYFIQQPGFNYKLLSIAPLVIGGYLLNYNTKNKEKFLEISYKADDVMKAELNITDHNELYSPIFEGSYIYGSNSDLEFCALAY